MATHPTRAAEPTLVALVAAVARRARRVTFLEALATGTFAGAMLQALVLVSVALADAAWARAVLIPATITSAAMALSVGAVSMVRHRHETQASSLVGRLDRAMGWQQLGVTAWEWATGRIATPFGPALSERAGQLGRAVPAGTLQALAGRVHGWRRALGVLAVAALISLPGSVEWIHERGRDIGRIVLPGSPPPGSLTLAPEERAFLRDLARLMEDQAQATTDPSARDAARLIQEIASHPAGAAAGDGATGSLPWGSEGSGGDGADLGPARQGAELGQAAPFALSERLLLLMRLAELGLITPDAANRAAEAAALLGQLEGRGATAPGDEGRDRAAASDIPPWQSGASPDASEPSPGSEQPSPERNERRATPDRPSSEREPGVSLSDQAGPEVPGAPRTFAEGQEAMTRRRAAAGEAPEDAGLGAEQGAPVPGDVPESQSQGSSVPGTMAGRLEAGALPSPGLEASAVLPLASHPQLGPGPAAALPGPPGPGDEQAGTFEWEAGSAPALEIDARQLPSIESVPMEYRDAVRRYFQSLDAEP